MGAIDYLKNMLDAPTKGLDAAQENAKQKPVEPPKEKAPSYNPKDPQGQSNPGVWNKNEYEAHRKANGK